MSSVLLSITLDRLLLGNKSFNSLLLKCRQLVTKLHKWLESVRQFSRLTGKSTQSSAYGKTVPKASPYAIIGFWWWLEVDQLGR